jgi:anthranilate/para-aminobenzoate synthase component I
MNQLTAQTTGAPADPLVLLARVRVLGEVAALVTAGTPEGGGRRRSYVAALPVDRASSMAPPATAPCSRSTFEGAPRWIGFLPYESARGMERPAWSSGEDRRERPHHVVPRWVRFGAVLVVDHATGTVTCVGEDPAMVRELARAASIPEHVGPLEARLRPPDDRRMHADRIREALRLIAAGDLYQVNLARRFVLELSGDPVQAFTRIIKASRPSFGACLFFHGEPIVISTSPELFLRTTTEGTVITRPIKGTRRRGRDREEDAALVRELSLDPKERAELAMVVDLERNDLGRVTQAGSVRVVGEPQIETHPTLHHRVATVRGTLRPGTSLDDLLRATFPSGSVTGAPKVRAMEVIAALEEARRGLYTGAIGHVAHDGTLALSIAIRTLTLDGAVGHYHAGGGIVDGSDPIRETDETELKALHLAALLG